MQNYRRFHRQGNKTKKKKMSRFRNQSQGVKISKGRQGNL